MAAASNGQNDKVLVMRGNEHYKKGDYDKAAEAYKKATDVNSANAKALYNLGNALYKSQQAEAAAKAFEAASEATTDKGFISRSSYNKGVMHSRQNQLHESIGSYKQALKLNPQDEQARENLQRALNELKKQQPPPPKQDQKNQNQSNNQNKPEPKPQNKSKLNEQQAERMLNALRQEEKRLQQNKQSKQRSGNMQEKDW
ncbi:tetratricopeptide repeat protein [Aridibaculum aurantiacum]|uniref:tetratricopeptide repeat protein n=1 Tax=Aridibaculum aurantiacum TaxID=2810307 RepID=UPI001A974048|nr:tetratricopeptide repeat protein [Aridibaculum aurantiacum]